MLSHLFGGIIGTIGMWFILREKTSSKIRQSWYWPIAVLVYLQIAIIGVSGWFAFVEDILHYFGKKMPGDEVMVPIIFGTMALAIIITGYINVYRPLMKARRELRGE